MTRPELSVLVVSYEMERALPRTIQSLSPAFQLDVHMDDYEVIVIDNGSRSLPDEAQLRRSGAPVRVVRTPRPNASPARAVNHGLAVARGSWICVMVDGARMASPGLLRWLRRAHRSFDRAVVTTLGWHLGPDVQQRSIAQGYNEQTEDGLLDGINWTEHGYRLFDISTLAVSSHRGWFRPFGESNAWSMPADMWSELGGYDEAFTSPGGGLVNHDALKRACALAGAHLVVVLGEGTFHQIHGGISTNSTSRRLDFKAEYEALRGERYVAPSDARSYVGAFSPSAQRFLRESALQVLGPEGVG